MKPEYWAEATRTLARKDRTLGRIIKNYQGETLSSRGDLFQTLARSITGQQISVKAAASVWRKVELGLGRVTPKNILTVSDDILRGYGLSGQKIKYLRHIALHCTEQKTAVSRWKKLDDEALIREITALNGVGRWTAEMMLIFYFLRPDIFPVADLGLLKAISIHYNDKKPVDKARALELAEGWRPWRTVATWYLWRALDPVPVEY